MNTEIQKILFICQANVGRSQMAEGFYNNFTSSTNGTSAGTNDYGKNYDFRPSPNIIQIMNEVGIDISRQLMKVVSQELIDQAEKIVVLCERERCPDIILTNQKTVYREVEDPFQQDLEIMRKIRDEIRELVKEFLPTVNE